MKLTPDEISALKALAQLAPTIVNSLQSSAASPPVKQEKRGRGRPKKILSEPQVNKGGQNVPTVTDLENRPPAPGGSGIKKVSNTVDTTEETEGEPVRRGGRKAVRSKGAACKREPMVITKRPNLFDQMDIAKKKNVEPDDKEWDKRWKKQKIKQRDPNARTTIVAVDCSNCRREFQVSPNEIKRDYDGNIEYICNDCLLEKR